MRANLGHCALISYFIHSVWSQGFVELTFSRDVVYSGEPLTLTFTYDSALTLAQLTVDAFNGTLKKGFLFFQPKPPNCTGVGVFGGITVDGWPNIPPAASSVNVTVTATPTLELNYNCTAILVDMSKVPPTSSMPACFARSPTIRVYPSTPKLQPSPVVFNDSDDGFVVCESRNGRPAAALLLTVRDRYGVVRKTVNDNELASVNLSSVDRPLWKWHNAVVTCNVTNHDSSNLIIINPKSFNSSISDNVWINYITNTSVPDVIYKNESVVLNCSKYISYYPGVLYKWKGPPEANVTGSLNEQITVQQGQIGSFSCTATNNVTMTSVVVVFTVSNVSRPSEPPTTGGSGCEQCWIIGLVIGIIVIIVVAVVLGVLCKRGHFSKGKKKPDVGPSGSDQRSDNGSNRGSHLYVYDGPASWETSTKHDSDAAAFHLVDRHTQASGEVSSRKGLAQPTSGAPALDRLCTEDFRKTIRLLIAAEGVVSQLAMRTLQSTAIVEYSDRSCSLNGILEKVEQAVTQSATKFKSVALLLRPAALGVTLSEVDQAVLNSSSIKGEKREKLRAFIARLAKICLDEHGGTRMDILNYKTGKAPKRLSEALTGLLGIPTTVSQDQFGVETPIGDEGGHAVVADLYFDRNNLGEVVYAVLELPTVKPPIQPRPVDEGVTYSEIRR